MALFLERMLQCAQKELDTADIVREAILQQLTEPLLIPVILKAKALTS